MDLIREVFIIENYCRSLPGRLVSVNGTVLKHFNNKVIDDEEDDLRSLTVEDYLEAAGVTLEDDIIRLESKQ